MSLRWSNPNRWYFIKLYLKIFKKYILLFLSYSNIKIYFIQFGLTHIRYKFDKFKSKTHMVNEMSIIFRFIRDSSLDFQIRSNMNIVVSNIYIVNTNTFLIIIFFKLKQARAQRQTLQNSVLILIQI